jgi:hypothetical protein
MESYNNICIWTNIILFGIPYFWFITMRFLYVKWTTNVIVFFTIFFYYQLEISPQFVGESFDLIDLAKLIWEYQF